MLPAVAADKLTSAFSEAMELAGQGRIAEGYATLCSARALALLRAADQARENELRQHWDDVIRHYGVGGS